MFLCILIGILGIIILIFSIPVKVNLCSDDKIHLTVKYLFVSLNILPTDPNKPKKEKKPKSGEEPKKETDADTPPKEKKPNPIIEMVKANGFDGMMTVLQNLGRVLGTYSGKLFKSIVFEEIDLYISVGTGDSAATAIKYGKLCQEVYPVFGFICANNIVKKYDINVEPDFLANKTEGEFFMDLKINLRKIINATIAMVIRLLFKVVLKFFTGGKGNKTTEQQSQNITANNQVK